MFLVQLVSYLFIWSRRLLIKIFLRFLMLTLTMWNLSKLSNFSYEMKWLRKFYNVIILSLYWIIYRFKVTLCYLLLIECRGLNAIATCIFFELRRGLYFLRKFPHPRTTFILIYVSSHILSLFKVEQMFC